MFIQGWAPDSVFCCIVIAVVSVSCNTEECTQFFDSLWKLIIKWIFTDWIKRNTWSFFVLFCTGTFQSFAFQSRTWCGVNLCKLQCHHATFCWVNNLTARQKIETFTDSLSEHRTWLFDGRCPWKPFKGWKPFLWHKSVWWWNWRKNWQSGWCPLF